MSSSPQQALSTNDYNPSPEQPKSLLLGKSKPSLKEKTENKNLLRNMTQSLVRGQFWKLLSPKINPTFTSL